VSEIPQDAIEAAFEVFRHGPGWPTRSFTERALDAATPALRKQFEDEHPVLAVIERAREEGLDATVYSYPPDRGRIILSEGSPIWSVLRTVDSHDRKPQFSLDECARELLASWPETT